jgi:hypothetical protein
MMVIPITTFVTSCGKEDCKKYVFMKAVARVHLSKKLLSILYICKAYFALNGL